MPTKRKATRSAEKVQSSSSSATGSRQPSRATSVTDIPSASVTDIPSASVTDIPSASVTDIPSSISQGHGMSTSPTALSGESSRRASDAQPPAAMSGESSRRESLASSTSKVSNAPPPASKEQIEELERDFREASLKARRLEAFNAVTIVCKSFSDFMKGNKDLIKSDDKKNWLNTLQSISFRISSYLNATDLTADLPTLSGKNDISTIADLQAQLILIRAPIDGCTILLQDIAGRKDAFGADMSEDMKQLDSKLENTQIDIVYPMLVEFKEIVVAFIRAK
jgi:hypothetical protein